MESAARHGGLRRGLRAAAVLATLLAATAAGAARADAPGPEHRFAVVREADPGLPSHTIVRPAALDEPGFRLPVVVWANGGCRDSNTFFHYFLMRLAAMGYLVVANGAPDTPTEAADVGGLAHPQPGKLVAAIDWVERANATPGGRFADRLDTSRIVAMGQSCGGGEALSASADPRVDATIAWNPYLGDPSAVHGPVLYVWGGAQDYTFPNTLAAYRRTTLPVVLAQNPATGHTGLFEDPADGSPPPGPFQDEPPAIAAAWMSFVLYGRDSGRAFFLGADCGLCRRSGWAVESRNWAGYAIAPSEAPALLPPSAGVACPASRTVTVRLRRPADRGVLYVDGRRRSALRHHRPVVIRVEARRSVTIRIIGRTPDGRRTVQERRTAACGGGA